MRFLVKRFLNGLIHTNSVFSKKAVGKCYAENDAAVVYPLVDVERLEPAKQVDFPRNSSFSMDKLSWRQRLQLWYQGYAYLFHKSKSGWRGKLPFYVVECKEHGLFIDYPHGLNGHFHCPKCLEDDGWERHSDQILKSLKGSGHL